MPGRSPRLTITPSYGLDLSETAPIRTILAIRVTPNARKTEVQGYFQDRLALRLKAPPVEGKANEEAVRWIAKAFGVNHSRVSLVRGERSRQKDYLIQGLAVEDAKATLMGLLKTSAATE